MADFLRPFWNVFAVWDDDPRARPATVEHLRGSAEFDDVRSVNGWTVGIKPLPKTQPLPKTLMDHGLFAIEGLDVLPAGDVDRPQYRVIPLLDEQPDRLAEIEGDVTLIHLKPDGTANLSRSPGGLVTLYHADVPGRRIVSTLLDWTHELEPRLRETDWEAAVVEVFLNDSSSRATAVHGVRRVHRGTYACPGGPRRAVAWWAPALRSPRVPTRLSRERNTVALRDALIGNLKRDLSGTSNLLTLSGGLDSTVLAYVATKGLGLPLTTLSLLPTDPTGRARELQYIRPIRDDLRLSDHVEQQFSLPRMTPSAVPLLNGGLDFACTTRPEVYFGGEVADWVVGSARFTFPDWVRATPAHHVLTRTTPRGRIRTLKGWLRLQRDPARAITARLHSADHLPSDLHEAVRAHVHGSMVERRRTPVVRAHLLWHIRREVGVAANWEYASRHSVRRAWPYASRSMFELAFVMHPHELISNVDKVPLRRAFRGSVPDRALARTGKLAHQTRLPSLIDIEPASAERLRSRGFDLRGEDLRLVARRHRMALLIDSIEHTTRG